MKFAKIITIIAFILHSFLTIGYFIRAFFLLPPIYKELEIETNIFTQVVVFIILLAFSLGSLFFYFHLRNKERKGEKVKYALLLSILLVIPLFILLPLQARVLNEPLYNLLMTPNP